MARHNKCNPWQTAANPLSRRGTHTDGDPPLPAKPEPPARAPATSLTRNDLTHAAITFCENSELNRISSEQAIRPEIAGMRIYDAPLLSVGNAADPFFDTLRRPGVVGEHFKLPGHWLPGALSVVSYFLPFTEQVRRANRGEPDWPAAEWLHARIEGQVLLNALSRRLETVVRESGFHALAPSLHPDFKSRTGKPGPAGEEHPFPQYSSNWSERHVAFVCGLGTFGLSAGLITARGIAGRFGSLVTTLPLDASPRPYSSHTEYCTRCGACVKTCPVAAISLQHGKDHTLCSPFIDRTMERFSPRYGCGKCQVGVPCEQRIPPQKYMG